MVQDAEAGGRLDRDALNPMLEVVDIARAAEVVHAAGALLAVDSTAATPILSRPLALGADLVMHSATKYLNGHSDVLVRRAGDQADGRALSGDLRRCTTPAPRSAPSRLTALPRPALHTDIAHAEACANASRCGASSSTAGSSGCLYPGLPSHPSTPWLERIDGG